MKRPSSQNLSARIIFAIRIKSFEEKLSHFVVDEFFMFNEAPVVPIRNFYDLCVWNIMTKLLNTFSQDRQSNFLSILEQLRFLFICQIVRQNGYIRKRVKTKHRRNRLRIFGSVISGDIDEHLRKLIRHPVYNFALW